MATTVTIATLPAVDGRVQSHISMTLNATHAAKLRQIQQGLIADSSSLSTSAAGYVIKTPEDAIRFLIETAAAA